LVSVFFFFWFSSVLSRAKKKRTTKLTVQQSTPGVDPATKKESYLKKNEMKQNQQGKAKKEQKRKEPLNLPFNNQHQELILPQRKGRT
jgi:hypothetical protein